MITCGRETIDMNADIRDTREYMVNSGDELIDEVIEERRLERADQLHNREESNSLRLQPAMYKKKNDEEVKSESDNNDNREHYKLGELSAKYEFQRSPDAIGYDNAGGYSYGRYQIATNTGTMQSYINYLNRHGKYHEYYVTLTEAGGYSAAKCKSKAFESIWKKLSKDKNFNESQQQFIIETHLKPLLNSIKEKEILNIDNRHPVVKDVLYSMSVQHYRAPSIVNNAVLVLKQRFGKNIDRITDEMIIKELYKQRALYVESLSESEQQNDGKITKSEKNNILKYRYPEELKDALNYLK